MSSPSRMAALTSDPRGRVISIFVGAVLLPSIALSFLSFHAVPRWSENTKSALVKNAQRVLWYVEKDLETMARAKALEAARRVGPEALVDGRPEPVRAAFARAGVDPDMFESLRLEGSSPLGKIRDALRSNGDDFHDLREALKGFEPAPGARGLGPPGGRRRASGGDPPLHLFLRVLSPYPAQGVLRERLREPRPGLRGPGGRAPGVGDPLRDGAHPRRPLRGNAGDDEPLLPGA